MSDERVKVRVLFVEDGGYHSEVLSLPGGGLDQSLLRYDAAIAFLLARGGWRMETCETRPTP